MEKDKTRIIIRLEKNGKYVERQLSRRILCGLFDLNYMLTDEVWDTIKLNGMEKDITKFFKIVEFLDGAFHGNGSYRERPEKHHIEIGKRKVKIIHQDKKLVKVNGCYLFGRPRWKRIGKSG